MSAKRHATRGLEVEPENARLVALSREAESALARIARLLASAERALREYRLTTPEKDNALHYYETVLEIEPGNARATEGKKRIVGVYATLARDKIESYQYNDARRLIDRGLQVQPGETELTRMLRPARS